MEIKDCFVIMPFSKTKSHTKDGWTEVFDTFFRPAWKSNNVNCYRVQVARGSITKEIIEKLYSASIVFADLTDSNPNVMYELGVRHTFKKPSILVKDKKTKIPFDVNDYNVYEYQCTPKGLKELKTHIKTVIKDIEVHPNKSDNPVWDFRNTSDFIIDHLRTIEGIQKLEALKEELESNLEKSISFLNKIKGLKVPEDFKDWSSGKTRLNENEEQIMQTGMEEFYPVIRNDALIHLKTTRYIVFGNSEWIVLDEIDKFLRWCNCFSNNLSSADFYEPERKRIEDFSSIIKYGIDIVKKRIAELKIK